MKSMILTTLATITLLATSHTAWASMTLTLVECQSLSVTPDAGLSLVIREVQGPPVVGQPGKSSLTAWVMEESIAGPRPVGSFPVVLKPHDPQLMGAPTVYFGKNFDLEIIVDAAPLPGGIFSHLTAETIHGRKISEDLSCRFTR